MDAKRVGIGRCLAHALVMTTLMGGLLAGTILPAWAAVRSAAPRPAGTPLQAGAPAAEMPSRGVVLAAPAPEAPAPVAARPVFDPDVERWRDLSVAASSSVQRATGMTLDDGLLLALVAVESGGQPDARSSAGAIGLTQVEPATYADLQVRYTTLLANRSLAEPSTNMLAGALYLVECARFLHVDTSNPATLALVLDAYNLGPRATAEWWHGGSPGPESLPDETIQHAARIMAAYAASG